jgi:hypothetical protein
MLLYASNICAQTSIEEVNSSLDTHPYFSIRLGYESDIVLPDSTKTKIIKALNRELPQHFADSVFTLSEVVLKNIEEYAWQECKTDTVCFEKTYAERCAVNIEFEKRNYSDRCYNINLILACGNWNVKEAIPYLEKELQDPKCKYLQVEIEMALAKLNDSIKQLLIEKYTLPYVMQTTQLDTINDEYPYYESFYRVPIPTDTTSRFPYDFISDNYKTIDILREGIMVAKYLKNRETILNLLDLIYIRGRDDDNIGISYTVSYFISDFDDNFRGFPNYNELKEICYDYASAIWRLDHKKRNKKEQKELKMLLSTEYRRKIKSQIREWIIENVSF